MEKQNIRIKLRAYDNKVLDASTEEIVNTVKRTCLLYTSPSPRDLSTARMPSSA